MLNKKLKTRFRHYLCRYTTRWKTIGRHEPTDDNSPLDPGNRPLTSCPLSYSGLGGVEYTLSGYVHTHHSKIKYKFYYNIRRLKASTLRFGDTYVHHLYQHNHDQKECKSTNLLEISLREVVSLYKL